MSLLLNKPGAEPGSSPAWRAPTVNLVPPETVERAKSRRVAAAFGLAGAAVLAATAGIWVSQSTAITAAEAEMDTATAELAVTRAEFEPLQPVNAFSLSVDEARQTIGTTMAGEVSFSGTLFLFDSALPVGSEVRTLKIVKGEACPGGDPFYVGVGAGCATWSVMVPGEAEVRELTAGMIATKGLFGPHLTTATHQAPQYEANGTVNIQNDLLTHRYDALLNEVAP